MTCSVDLLNGRSASWIIGRRSSSTSHIRHTAHIRHASHSTSAASHLLKNRHGNTLKCLLLLFVLLLLSSLVGIEPGGGFVDSVENSSLVLLGDLVLHFITLNGRLQRVAVVLKTILGPFTS